jgi:hypothetical protein
MSAWRGTLRGSGVTTAYYSWLLIPVADGCRVVSEKLDYGGNLSAASGLRTLDA